MYIGLNSMKVQEHIPLAPFTTFGVGGPARYFTEASNEADVRDALDFANTRNLPVFVLGGGSNLVVSDDGFAGLVLKIAIRGLDESADRDRRLFQAGAG